VDLDADAPEVASEEGELVGVVVDGEEEVGEPGVERGVEGGEDGDRVEEDEGEDTAGAADEESADVEAFEEHRRDEETGEGEEEGHAEEAGRFVEAPGFWAEGEHVTGEDGEDGEATPAVEGEESVGGVDGRGDVVAAGNGNAGRTDYRFAGIRALQIEDRLSQYVGH